MKISCPACAAKYSVSDDKIQARLAKIRCRKCSATIVIDGTVSPPAVSVGEVEGKASTGRQSQAPGEAVGPAPNEFAVDIADDDQRNMTVAQIVEAYNAGIVSSDTYIWREGMADWQTVAEVPEVCDALRSAAKNFGTAAPRARADSTSSADLFGGIERAGSEEDISTSAPEPAPAVTGARNESSVLFSLSALTGQQQTETASRTSKSSARSEDSGLIDLQALTASSGEGGVQIGMVAPMGGVNFGASPLIAPPLVPAPMGGGFDASRGDAPNRSRVGLFAVGGVVVLAAAAAALVFALRGDEPPTPVAEPKGGTVSAPAQVAEGQRAPVPQPSVAKPAGESPAAVAEADDEEPSEAPPGSVGQAVLKPPSPEAAKPGAAAAVAAPASKPAPNRPAAAPKAPPARAPKPAAAAETPKPAPAAAPAPAPAAPAKKACDCKPTDLMCAMRCSAKQ